MNPDGLPLEGIRVLDLSRWITGPFCTMLLADAGAEVIQLEPSGGIDNRSAPPFIESADGTKESVYYLRFARGKKSVVLDPRKPMDRPIFDKLLSTADVLVTNYRPRVLEACGYNWDELHRRFPKLIFATVSGFGYTNEKYRNWPAFNIVVETMAGVVSRLPLNGNIPASAGLPFGDSVTGLNATASITMALYKRTRTGVGSRVDVAMYDTMLSINEWTIAVKAATGVDIDMGGTGHLWFAPYGLYQAADGWLCIAVVTDEQWKKFCVVAELENLLEDPEFQSGPSRVTHAPEKLNPGIERWLRGKTRSQAVEKLVGAGVPAAPLQLPGELISDELAVERDMLPELSIREGQKVRLAGNPLRIEPRRQAYATGFARLGENTEEVLKDLR